MSCKTYTITIDNPTLDEYAQYYFSVHTKARKKPIEKPYLSLNTWMILPRQQMNCLKQKWKDFIIWYINKLGLQNEKLEQFNIEELVFMPTKRRSDPDNFVPKFVLDGFTESGFIIDDDGRHLKKLSISTDYDKDNPRTVFIVTTIEQTD